MWREAPEKRPEVVSWGLRVPGAFRGAFVLLVAHPSR
jgi:hypothetical protein